MQRLSLTLTLAALLGISACAPKAEPSLTRRVLFTASGSYDAQADTRGRVGGGLRRVIWTSRPPLPARSVTVQYDGNNRTLAWQLEVVAPRFTAADLAGDNARTVSTSQGKALRPAGNALGDVLLFSTADGLRLLTRGYAAQQEPELLEAFR
ncbi:hypothetical protein [Deinococcus sp. YIM 77859]|uniref:hypothetical protein n=1 Tax=Deinococcus sp. YIM 77859 TaxID=1540221 RepID=UPI00054FAE95|nr:hypothetical protein [Deinococcus sp. YIM 77859]